MTAAVARYQGNWVELAFAKTSGIVNCGLWTVDRGKSVPEVFSNLTGPGFFQCFKGREWNDGSRPSMKALEISEIIQMIAAFLPCRGDSTFFIIQRFLFNKSCTFFLPFFNCKNKEKRSLKQRTRECFYVTIIFAYIRKCTERVKEMLHHYSSIMLDLLVSLLCPK